MAHLEMRSVAIVARLLTESSFEYLPEEIAFVQSLIAPSKGQDGFLYHIVANQVNHLDVDKMEYIKRDARACGLSQGGFDTDTRRILNNARVIDGMICYNHKVYEDIYNLFQTRYRLHTTVYRHPAVVATHHMISDALVASGLPLRESIDNIDSFCKYDDTIIDTLRGNAPSKVTREIIHRIDTRDLYKVVVTSKRSKPWSKNPTRNDLLLMAKQNELELPADSILVECSCVGFTGKADGHPMDSLRFFDSSSPNKSFSVKRTSVSTLLAARYCEYWTRVIVKDSKYADSAVSAFNAWKASI